MKHLLMMTIFLSQPLYAFNEYDNVKWDEVINKNVAISKALGITKNNSEISSDFDNENSELLQTVSCSGLSRKDARLKESAENRVKTDACDLVDPSSLHTDSNGFGTPAGFGWQYASCPHTWIDKVSWKRSDGQAINIHLEYRAKCERMVPKTDAKRKKFEVSVRGVRENELLAEAHREANEKVAAFLKSLKFNIQSRGGDIRALSQTMSNAVSILRSFESIEDSQVQSAYGEKLKEFCSKARTAYGSSYSTAYGTDLSKVRQQCSSEVASAAPASTATEDNSSDEAPAKSRSEEDHQEEASGGTDQSGDEE